MARAMGLYSELAEALSALGVLRGRIGDVVGAERAFGELIALDDKISSSARALALHNAAWVALEARARGQAASDPEPQLVAAAAIFAPDGLRPDALLAAETRLSLVYAKLVRGDVAGARSDLADLLAPTRSLRRWKDYLAAQADLMGGDHPAALHGFSVVAKDASEAGDRSLEWSVAVGAGDAFERPLGRVEDALDRYRVAAAIHGCDIERLAIDAGRERFAAERNRGSQRLVTLLLRLGREEVALCAARQARSEGLAGLVSGERPTKRGRSHRVGRISVIPLWG